MSHFVCLPDHCSTQHHTFSSRGQILPENKQQQAPELTRLVATPRGEVSDSAPPGAGSVWHCQSPGLEVVVLVHDSTAESTSSSASCCAHLTRLHSSPSNISTEWAAAQERQGHSVKSASRRKEASVSVLQKILDNVEMVSWYQDWHKGGECLEQPRYSWVDALTNTLSEAGPCCGALITPLLSQAQSSGQVTDRWQRQHQVPVLSDWLQLP